MNRSFPINPDLERGYNLRLLRDDMAQLLEDWTGHSAKFRSHADARLDCAYDSGPGDRLDLFYCGQRHAPLLVFIHGGYWQRGDKSMYSFIAEPFVEMGVDLALIGYSLCPETDMRSIVTQVRRALTWLWRQGKEQNISPDRINLSGHSAGGHLTALMMATDWTQLGDDLPPDLIKTAIPMSGLYQLEPLLQTSINDALGMDARVARSISPYFLQPATDAPVLVTVGGGESPQLRWQSDQFAEHWGAYSAVVNTCIEPNVDHFDLMNRLANRDSEIFSKVCAWLK